MSPYIYLGVAEDGGRNAVDHVGVDIAAVLHLEDLPPFLLRQFFCAVSPSPRLTKNATAAAAGKPSDTASKIACASPTNRVCFHVDGWCYVAITRPRQGVSNRTINQNVSFKKKIRKRSRTHAILSFTKEDKKRVTKFSCKLFAFLRRKNTSSVSSRML